jgi:predicted AlkP superfamily phosphohydrolase/phosphomutase
MVSKVIVIGLDGATFDLISPWIENGEMPNLRQLIQGGISGELTSTYPPLTGPAWSSFMTGKSPSHHGVLEFFHRINGEYRQKLNNPFDIDGSSLWQLLSSAGKRVGVLGVPLTYPPERINGFLITGLLTPAGRRDFTHPPELLDEIEKQIGTYRLRHDEKYRKSNPEPFIQEQYEILENNTQAIEYLMTNKSWDFMMAHILGTDRMQHEFWHVIDPRHPQHDPIESEKLGNVLLDFFREVDNAIGRIINLAGDAAIIIMSDHGFGPVYKFINFNTWLLEKKFLKLKRSFGTQLRYLIFKMGFNYTQLGNWILKLGLGRRAKRLGRGKREDLQRRVFLSLNDVDWSRSRVYSMGNFGQLFVNLEGREPMGIVSPGEEYESLLDELTQELLSLTDPETKQPVVEKIFRRDDIYNGPYSEQAPDLVFFTQRMEYKAMGLSDFSSPKIIEPVYGTTGHHRMNGVLICNKPGVFKQSDGEIEEAHIYDLTPTILYLMDLNIPESMDGKVLFDLFTDEFRENCDPKYSNPDFDEGTRDQNDLTEQEEAKLAEILRSLGYVN